MFRRALIGVSVMAATLLSVAGGVASAAPAAPAAPAVAAVIACGSGQVCIYPQINYGGTPFVRRATDSSTSLVGYPINENTFSVINNGTGNRTARIYRASNYTGSYTCIQPGGRIPDLRGYAVGQYGSSLKLNNDRCG